MNTPTDTQGEIWRLALRCGACPQASTCPHANAYRRFPSEMGGANECPRIPDLAPFMDAPTFGDVLDVSAFRDVVTFAHFDDGPYWRVWVANISPQARREYRDVMAMPAHWVTDCLGGAWVLDLPDPEGTTDTLARRVQRVRMFAVSVGAGVIQ